MILGSSVRVKTNLVPFFTILWSLTFEVVELSVVNTTSHVTKVVLHTRAESFQFI